MSFPDIINELGEEILGAQWLIFKPHVVRWLAANPERVQWLTQRLQLLVREGKL